MTTLMYEWTGDDDEKKFFNTFPEATDWKQTHGGTVKQLMNFVPSRETEHCISGATTSGHFRR